MTFQFTSTQVVFFGQSRNGNLVKKCKWNYIWFIHKQNIIYLLNLGHGCSFKWTVIEINLVLKSQRSLIWSLDYISVKGMYYLPIRFLWGSSWKKKEQQINLVFNGFSTQGFKIIFCWWKDFVPGWLAENLEKATDIYYTPENRLILSSTGSGRWRGLAILRDGKQILKYRSWNH